MCPVRRRHALVALCGALTAALAFGGPAAAQTPSTDESTTASTDSTTTTSTTVPPSSVPASTSTTVADPGINGDAPPESVPDVSVTIPPRDPPTGTGSGAVAPSPGRVVRVDLRAAKASALARQANYESAVAHRQELEQTLNGLQQRVGQLAEASRKAVRDLANARQELADRAVDAYVRGSGLETDTVIVPLSTSDEQRSALMSAVVDRDREAVDRVKELQSKVTSDQASTAKQLNDAQSQLEQAQVDEAQALIDLTDAKLDLAVSTAGGNVVIHGFVFPVASPHSFSEDFGDPRLPGTPQAHTHQGCDVIAAEGTELYAAERGVVTQLSSGGLGGNGLWIKGESGTAYYYAHLSAYEPTLRAGQLVEAGARVGFVGHTGDAFGPHLHFEVHPGGGAAVDPYPILLASDPQQQTQSSRG